ncbi:MAG: triose-phosphate isomerase, partial [Deltaproteobacteria bacterium]|nr:triose-phosphate isomerase [Deltaproteobacteria bacterium]
ANWKMNLLAADARAWPAKLEAPAGVELLVCPPLALLPVLRDALGPAGRVALGAQNVHPAAKGAFTGEHSCAMLLDAGARYVLVGHSERRAMFGDTDAFVADKLRAALNAGLRPVLCVGERLAERESGATFRVLRGQLTAALAGLGLPSPEPATLVVAYEPVWAIGTGRNATAEQAQEALAFVRERLAELLGWTWARAARILYGGSATPANAAELAAQPDVDGFLVGGASLDPAAFSAIAAATARAKEQR